MDENHIHNDEQKNHPKIAHLWFHLEEIKERKLIYREKNQK